LKIEIKTGKKDRGKQITVPAWYNTKVKIDGVKLMPVTYLAMEVEIGKPVKWICGYQERGNEVQRFLKLLYWKLKWKLMRLMR